MKRFILAGTALAFGATLAFAQTDPVAHRIELMKRTGDATKIVSDMTKGAVPFDLAKVKETLTLYVTVAKESPALFPDTAKTGTDSTAAPKIWENKADFEAKFKKWEEVSTAAEAKITDEATFKAEIRDVLASCKSCHDEYRVKK